MKKRIISVVLVVAIVFGYISLSKILSDGRKTEYGFSKNGIAFSQEGNDITDSVISSAQYTLDENEKYKLEITNQADIQIVSKTSGQVWKAVPDNNFGNSKYSSSLILTYFVDEKTKKTVYSSQDAVAKNQFRIFQTKNGARVEYVFGELTSIYVYPNIISKERLEMYLDKMDPEDGEYILRRYQLYVLSEYEKNEREYLLSLYPRLKEENLYILSDISTPFMKNRVNDIFMKAGYTEEDQKKDNGDYSADAKNPQSFKIAVQYKLTAEGFTASLDLENCAFYNDYPIDNLQILPYFNAYGKEEEGYFVLPSGSGALTYINSTKTKEQTIELPVFGKNLAIYPQNDVADNQCAFPMYGAYKNGSAYVCMFNRCGQQTSIHAETGQSYSTVCPSYSIIDSQVSSLKSEAIIWFSASELSTDTIEAEYRLIEDVTDGDAYSEMARIYRESLISQGFLTKHDVGQDIPLVANIFNTINYDTMQFGCFPVNKEFSLTTFEESFTIAEELSRLTGNANLYVLLTGWNHKGLGAQTFNKPSYSKIAGGQKGLLQLQDRLLEKLIAGYLDVEFNFMKPHSNDRFNSDTQAVRDINNAVVHVERYNPKLDAFEKTSLQLISPTQFKKVFDGFAGNELFHKSGMGVNQLTQLLYSDYANGTVKSKSKTITEITRNLKALQEKKISLIGDGANIYSLKYLDILNHVPITSNNDNFFDEDIPFVQMVLHGYLPYASATVNDFALSDDMMLKLIETGSGLNYRLTMNSFGDIFETDYSYLYNAKYENNKESIAKCYKKVAKALKNLNDRVMISHRRLTDKVVETEYENGTKIILNYGNSDYTYNGKICKPHDYLRVDDTTSSESN